MEHFQFRQPTEFQLLMVKFSNKQARVYFGEVSMVILNRVHSIDPVLEAYDQMIYSQLIIFAVNSSKLKIWQSSEWISSERFFTARLHR